MQAVQNKINYCKIARPVLSMKQNQPAKYKQVSYAEVFKTANYKQISAFGKFKMWMPHMWHAKAAGNQKV